MERFQRNPAVDETELDGEVFLVEPISQDVFYLDAVSSGLWRLLAEPQSLVECQAVFRDAFPDEDPARIDRDVEAALREFVERRLAVIVP